MKNLLVALTFIISCIFSNLFAQALWNNLVAYYPFYGNSKDFSTLPKNGQVVGATLISDRFLHPSRAYQFSSGNYINLGSHASLGFTTGSFSISLWCKTAGNGTTMALVQKYTGGSTVNGYGLEIASNGKIVFFTSNGSGNTGSPPDSYNLFGSTSITDNNWHLINAIYDDIKDSLILYVDTKRDGSSYCPTSPSVSTSNVNIGRREWNNLIPFIGVIDEVRFHNRVITTSEINTIFNFNGLIAHYPFSSSGTDISGFGYNATINGVVSSNDRFNQQNNAFLFNGSNSYVDIGNIQQLSFLQGEYSLCAWVKISSTNSKTIGIVQKYTGGSLSLKGYGLEVTPGGYPLFFISNGTGTSGGPPDSYNTVGNINIVDNTWHHIAVSYSDLSDSVKLYIDGNLNKVEYTPSNPAENTSSINVGRREWNNLIHFNGLIDEVRFYDVALSSAEISDFYDLSKIAIKKPSEINYVVYPIPAIHEITVSGIPIGENISIKLLNASGQSLKTFFIQSSDPNLIVNIDDLASGIYYLQILSKVGIKTNKLVKL